MDMNFVAPPRRAATEVCVYTDDLMARVNQALTHNLPNFTCWVHVVSSVFLDTGSTHTYRLDQPCSVSERRVFILHAAYKTYPCVQLGCQYGLSWQWLVLCHSRIQDSYHLRLSDFVPHHVSVDRCICPTHPASRRRPPFERSLVPKPAVTVRSR